MRKRTLPLTVFGLLLIASPVLAGIEIEISQWGADLDMTARVDQNELNLGTDFDLESDFGVDGDQDLDGLQVHLNWGKRDKHHLFLARSQADYRGMNLLTRSITVDDTTYTASETVGMNLDFTVGRAYYGYSFISKDKFQFGIQGGVLVLDTDGNVTASLSGSETFDITAPIPVIGAHLRIKLSPRQRIHLIANGMSLDVGDVDGTATEYEGKYSLQLLRWLALSAGVRSLDVDVSVVDEGRFDLSTEGGFYSITLRW